MHVLFCCGGAGLPLLRSLLDWARLSLRFSELTAATAPPGQLSMARLARPAGREHHPGKARERTHAVFPNRVRRVLGGLRELFGGHLPEGLLTSGPLCGASPRE
eukprot:6396509-Pyramimonas_sp.AAC.1